MRPLPSFTWQISALAAVESKVDKAKNVIRAEIFGDIFD
jgi:hypothetical protein